MITSTHLLALYSEKAVASRGTARGMSVCAICLQQVAEEDEAFVEGCLHRFCLSVKVSFWIQIVEKVPCASKRLVSCSCMRSICVYAFI